MYRIVSKTLTSLGRSVFSSLSARNVMMRNDRTIISFTFDDFPRSAVSNGARILEDHGARGTFYLTGSYCGRVIDEVPQYGEEELAAVAGAGHEIGCHTFTHPRVSTLSAAALDREIELNTAFMARHISGRLPRTFAYPFGDVSLVSYMRLRRRFAGCRTSEPGLNFGTVDLGKLRSIRLYDRLMSAEGVSRIIKEALDKTAWLIFYSHDVAERPTNFGCSPAILEHAVKSAISLGATIKPMDAAINAVLGN